MKMHHLFLIITILLSGIHTTQAEEIKSAPNDPVIATILGNMIKDSELNPTDAETKIAKKAVKGMTWEEWVQGYRKNKLRGIVMETLLTQYVEEQNLSPTEDEIKQFANALHKIEEEQSKGFFDRRDAVHKKLKSPDLSQEDKKDLEKELESLSLFIQSRKRQKDYEKEHPREVEWAERNIAETMVLSWKLNKSLFDKYGGRIIFQQAGPEPIDAYRKLLEEKEKAGDLEISKPALRDSFWEYFKKEKMHNFYSEQEGNMVMEKPWWLLEEGWSKK